MAIYQLLLPKMGESVAEATIIRWLKSPGDFIEADDAVLEIATDKVDSEVPSPVSGKLVKQLFNENDVAQVGSVIAEIETDVKQQQNDVQPTAPADSKPQPTPVTANGVPSQVNAPANIKTDDIPGVEQVQQRAQAQPLANQATVANADRFYSPLVKNIANQENISQAELNRIPGTGSDGRLTKDDLLNYIHKRGSAQMQQGRPAASSAPQPVAQPQVKPAAPEVPKAATTPVAAAAKPSANIPPQQPAAQPKPAVAQPQAQQQQSPRPAAPQPQQQPAAPKPAASAQPKEAYISSAGDEIVEMDRMRRLIADHMVMSKQVSPHVTSFVEADVTNLVNWREKIKKDFESKVGERITFTPMFVQAVVKAIKDMPMVNVSVNGTQIIKKKDINIGMATALPSGNLIVPVIHKADSLNLVGLTKSVNDLANRARSNKLQPDEIKNGTFTITNVGSFGNVMGTPIINQPQVAILAIGVIKKKPAVLETKDGDVIAIRHMMFLSLSYDHRVVDGALGGSFLRRVADYLENWDPNTTY